jgi:tartrate dehydrogenase/decarboxylase / D-malate dehydrogenase
MSVPKIAVIPGDGIGQEVMREAIKVLDELEKMYPTFSIEKETFEWNSEYYLKTGRMMPEDGLEQLQSFDAILFGAMGDPRVPDHVTVWDFIMPIRKTFEQYVNMRKIQTLPGIPSPFTEQKLINLTFFRENAEGEYSNIGGRLYNGKDDEIAVQNTVMTRRGIERIASYAFEYAARSGKRKVTSVTKSNAIIHSMRFWDEVVERVGNHYPDIQLESYYVDAFAAHLVNRPETFEVAVASNLFGDILTDMGAALVGGLGISPSGNINPDRKYPSMFEPIHGSAPDIAGKQLANPIAQIWSLALMLEFLERDDLSDVVMDAIISVLTKGDVLSRDLGGSASTCKVGDAIVHAMRYSREGKASV